MCIFISCSNYNLISVTFALIYLDVATDIGL